MSKRVLMHSQSLLGVGHERRTQLIANALAARGLDTHIALGGPSALGLSTLAHTHHLPTLRAADAAFSGLVDDTGAAVDDAYRDRRQQALAALFDTLAPDALLLELFPFGRRMLRFELLPLLEQAASAGCTVVCSLRDILVAKAGDRAAEKRQWAVDLVKRQFDAVLVHGDPDFVPLESSFQEAAQLASQLRYTGLVAPAPRVPPTDRRGVLVSAGGGAVGAPLLDTALAAAKTAADATQPWTLVAGPHCPDGAFERLSAVNHPHITVLRSHPNLVELMATHAASVSQAGYNTVCDLLVTRTPSVLVPFATQTETEQQLRADRLASHTAFASVESESLTEARLLQAVSEVMQPGDWPTFDLDGASVSAEQLCCLLES
ncbi:MAG: glycosyltransferase [Pseudomonadota bacterium]